MNRLKKHTIWANLYTFGQNCSTLNYITFNQEYSIGIGMRLDENIVFPILTDLEYLSVFKTNKKCFELCVNNVACRMQYFSVVDEYVCLYNMYLHLNKLNCSYEFMLSFKIINSSNFVYGWMTFKTWVLTAWCYYFSEEDYDAFCLAYMFTYRDFEMGTLGLAWTGDLKNAGGVCEKNGVSNLSVV